MDRFARGTISGTVGLIAMLGACGGDEPTAPPTAAASLTFTSQPTEALDRVPLSSVRVTALDANGKPATVPVDVTVDVTSARGDVALEGARRG